MDALLRDPVAGKGLAREGVDQLPPGDGAEVPPLHGIGGDQGEKGRAPDHPQAVIAAEHLQPRSDRRPQAHAELVTLEFRQRLPHRVEVIAGVKIVVAVVFVDRAVDFPPLADRKRVDDQGGRFVPDRALGLPFASQLHPEGLDLLQARRQRAVPFVFENHPVESGWGGGALCGGGTGRRFRFLSGRGCIQGNRHKQERNQRKTHKHEKSCKRKNLG